MCKPSMRPFYTPNAKICKVVSLLPRPIALSSAYAHFLAASSATVLGAGLYPPTLSPFFNFSSSSLRICASRSLSSKPHHSRTNRACSSFRRCFSILALTRSCRCANHSSRAASCSRGVACSFMQLFMTRCESRQTKGTENVRPRAQAANAGGQVERMSVFLGRQQRDGLEGAEGRRSEGLLYLLSRPRIAAEPGRKIYPAPAPPATRTAAADSATAWAGDLPDRSNFLRRWPSWPYRCIEVCWRRDRNVLADWTVQECKDKSCQHSTVSGRGAGNLDLMLLKVGSESTDGIHHRETPKSSFCRFWSLGSCRVDLPLTAFLYSQFWVTLIKVNNEYQVLRNSKKAPTCSRTNS